MNGFIRIKHSVNEANDSAKYIPRTSIREVVLLKDGTVTINADRVGDLLFSGDDARNILKQLEAE